MGTYAWNFIPRFCPQNPAPGAADRPPRARPVRPYTGIWLRALNPFLSVHIPYVQSEGILPQIRLLQWRVYIFRNTQCFSTKLGRNMVNALFCHKTLKYWWPLTYIQGHVIQDGCQIQSEKSILGQKIAITRPIFWQIWSFLFCLLLNTSSIL